MFVGLPLILFLYPRHELRREERPQPHLRPHHEQQLQQNYLKYLPVATHLQLQAFLAKMHQLWAIIVLERLVSHLLGI